MWLSLRGIFFQAAPGLPCPEVSAFANTDAGGSAPGLPFALLAGHSGPAGAAWFWSKKTQGAGMKRTRTDGNQPDTKKTFSPPAVHAAAIEEMKEAMVVYADMRDAVRNAAGWLFQEGSEINHDTLTECLEDDLILAQLGGDEHLTEVLMLALFWLENNRSGD